MRLGFFATFVAKTTTAMLLATTTAHADPPPQETITVEITVEEHSGKTLTDRASYVVPITGERVPTKLSELTDGVHYKLEAERTSGDAEHPVIALDLQRRSVGAKVHVDQSMRAATRVARGARVLVGHFEQKAGATDVYLSLR